MSTLKSLKMTIEKCLGECWIIVLRYLRM